MDWTHEAARLRRRRLHRPDLRPPACRRARAVEDLIEHVTDRPGHDRRYSLASDKIRALAWEPRVRFAEGLERTVDWDRENHWCEAIRSGDCRAYRGRQYGCALAESSADSPYAPR